MFVQVHGGTWRAEQFTDNGTEWSTSIRDFVWQPGSAVVKASERVTHSGTSTLHILTATSTPARFSVFSAGVRQDFTTVSRATSVAIPVAGLVSVVGWDGSFTAEIHERWMTS